METQSISERSWSRKMTKLNEVVTRTKDPALQEFLDDITIFWNGGHYSFKLISSEPTDSPTDPEIRVFDSGSALRLYVYGPSSAAWYKSADFTAI